MLEKQKYREYLTKKTKKEELLKERLWYLDEFEAAVERNGVSSITDITEKNIFEFIKPDNPDNRRGYIQKADEFFIDYASFIKKECAELNHFASVINDYYMKSFEEAGKNAAAQHKRKILPITEDFKANPKYLYGLTNSQFVGAFKELQQFVINSYDDIEKSPFDWGYPDFRTTDGYYNRVIDILFAFAFFGTYNDGDLIVDAKKFFAYSGVKRHKKVELMIVGFERNGLLFENFDSKSESFYVSYPANPHIIAALCAYAQQMDIDKPQWKWEPHRNSLSYRYVENPATQKYESVFLAEMDYKSQNYFEIQCWLHSEAAKYGFSIDINEPMEKGCILYKKGSKRFLLVGERKKDGTDIIWSKTSYIDVFEKAPDKMRVLCDRFPEVFRLEDEGKCCHEDKCMFRMSFTFDGVSYLRCGLGNFVFENITLDDVKIILELYIIEKKIKPLN